MSKPEYLEKALLLSAAERERVLSRMSGKLPRRLEKDKLSVDEALAIQLEIEDEQLHEWREKMHSLKGAKKEAKPKAEEKSAESAKPKTPPKAKSPMKMASSTKASAKAVKKPATKPVTTKPAAVKATLAKTSAPKSKKS